MLNVVSLVVVPVTDGQRVSTYKRGRRERGREGEDNDAQCRFKVRDRMKDKDESLCLL